MLSLRRRISFSMRLNARPNSAYALLRPALLLSGVVTSLACHHPDATAEDSSLLVSATATGDGLVLDRSPNELAITASGITLEPDLTIGGVSDVSGLASIADVTTFDDGRLIILDVLGPEVLIFDSNGVFIRRLATGGIPLLKRPIAVVGESSRAVFLQPSAHNTLLAMSASGSLLHSRSSPLPGDWWSMAHRPPKLWLDSRHWSTGGSEDITRRITVAGDSYIAVLVFDEESVREDGGEVRDLAATVGLLDSSLRLLDTLRLPAGVRLRRHTRRFTMRGTGQAIELRDLAMPLFSAKTLLAGGDEWVAIADGVTGAVRVLSVPSMEPRLTVSWREVGRAIEEEDRREAVRHIIRHQASLDGNPAPTGRELTEGISEGLAVYPLAERAPSVVALYGAGNCLWLSGFSAVDYVDGTSLSWIAVDVRSGAVLGVFRVEPAGQRVRHISRTAIYASGPDGWGLPLLRRYPLPGSVAKQC